MKTIQPVRLPVSKFSKHLHRQLRNVAIDCTQSMILREHKPRWELHCAKPAITRALAQLDDTARCIIGGCRGSTYCIRSNPTMQLQPICTSGSKRAADKPPSQQRAPDTTSVQLHPPAAPLHRLVQSHSLDPFEPSTALSKRRNGNVQYHSCTVTALRHIRNRSWLSTALAITVWRFQANSCLCNSWNDAASHTTQPSPTILLCLPGCIFFILGVDAANDLYAGTPPR